MACLSLIVLSGLVVQPWKRTDDCCSGLFWKDCLLVPSVSNLFPPAASWPVVVALSAVQQPVSVVVRRCWGFVVPAAVRERACACSCS